jgi:hypothetical protein
LEYLGLHNKSKAEMHPGLTGPKEKEEGEEEEKDEEQQPNFRLPM